MITELTPAARALLHEWDISTREWADWCYFSDGIWRGASCGCIDPDCAVNHWHKEDGTCTCLPTMVRIWAFKVHGWTPWSS